MPRNSNRKTRHSSSGTHFFSRRNARAFLFTGSAVLIIALIAGVLVIGNSILNPSGYPKTISPARAQGEIAKGALVLDVRESDEYTQGHIPGSIWIPLGELPSRLSELPRDRLIIVVCRTGVRSAQGVDILLAAGFSQVTSLSGGMIAWSSTGYPITAGAPAAS